MKTIYTETCSQKTESTENVVVTLVSTEKSATSDSENVMNNSNRNEIEEKKDGKKENMILFSILLLRFLVSF